LADVETTPFSGLGEQAYWNTVSDSLVLNKTTDFGRFERLSVNPWIKRICISKRVPPH